MPEINAAGGGVELVVKNHQWARPREIGGDLGVGVTESGGGRGEEKIRPAVEGVEGGEGAKSGVGGGGCWALLKLNISL